MDLYAENILEHYRHPRCKRELSNPTVEHAEVNHSCGDAVKIGLKIEGDTISEISWSGEGCAISQAGVSMLCEEMEAMTPDDVLKLKKDDIYEMFGVPIGTRRFKCALICLHTMKNAIRKSKGLEPQGWLDTVELTD